MRDVLETRNRRMFLFITGACNRSCKYCFMKGNSYTEHMNKNIRSNALEKARSNDYQKITLIGGEPLLHPEFLDCVHEVINLGLDCSISTSGTDDNNLLRELFDLSLDDITVSLDSCDETVNDSLRGTGAYKKAINTIKLAIDSGIHVRVTSTINGLNKDNILDTIKELSRMGIFQMDFHLLSYNGNAKKNRNLGLSPMEWVELRKEISSFDHSGMAISIPYIWLDSHDPLASEYCEHCEMVNFDRISVMPNGDCYLCTLAIGEEAPFCNIVDNFPSLSEIKADFDKYHICHCERQIGMKECEKYMYVCRFVKDKIV